MPAGITDIDSLQAVLNTTAVRYLASLKEKSPLPTCLGGREGAGQRLNPPLSAPKIHHHWRQPAPGKSSSSSLARCSRPVTKSHTSKIENGSSSHIPSQISNGGEQVQPTRRLPACRFSSVVSTLPISPLTKEILD